MVSHDEHCDGFYRTPLKMAMFNKSFQYVHIILKHMGLGGQYAGCLELSQHTLRHRRCPKPTWPTAGRPLGILLLLLLKCACV